MRTTCESTFVFDPSPFPSLLPSLHMRRLIWGKGGFQNAEAAEIAFAPNSHSLMCTLQVVAETIVPQESAIPTSVMYLPNSSSPTMSTVLQNKFNTTSRVSEISVNGKFVDLDCICSFLDRSLRFLFALPSLRPPPFLCPNLFDPSICSSTVHFFSAPKVEKYDLTAHFLRASHFSLLLFGDILTCVEFLVLKHCKVTQHDPWRGRCLLRVSATPCCGTRHDLRISNKR